MLVTSKGNPIPSAGGAFHTLVIAGLDELCQAVWRRRPLGLPVSRRVTGKHGAAIGVAVHFYLYPVSSSSCPSISSSHISPLSLQLRAESDPLLPS